MAASGRMQYDYKQTKIPHIQHHPLPHTIHKQTNLSNTRIQLLLPRTNITKKTSWILEKECWPRPVGYSTAITSYEILHFQTLKGDSRVKRPMILRYAPMLQQILSNVRTGVAGAAVVSGRVELKDGFMSFLCFVLRSFYWRRGEWPSALCCGAV